MNYIEDFCESLDGTINNDLRIEHIDNAIRRLQFEKRLRSLTPLQIQHMCGDSLGPEALAKIGTASGTEREELITMYARALYFRRCAWVAYLNGERDDPPIEHG